VPVALGSDFNPNAHCLSLPHIMNLVRRGSNWLMDM
jgi:hypothetical protein